jgi:hypothetical protein
LYWAGVLQWHALPNQGWEDGESWLLIEAFSGHQMIMWMELTSFCWGGILLSAHTGIILFVNIF